MPAAVEACLGPVCARAVIEVVIGDMIIRAGWMPMKHTSVA